MDSYLLSLVIIFVLTFAVFMIFRLMPLRSDTPVRIVIYADDPDETEKAILNAYYYTSKYFSNAEICVSGKNSEYVNMLVKAYRFLKRDEDCNE